MLLKDTYYSAKNNFADLTEISEQELNSLEQTAEKYQREKNTNRAVLINYAAAFSLLLFPIIVVKIPEFFSIISQYLLSKQGSYSDEYIGITIASLGLTSVALLMYFFVMPNENLRINKFIKTKPIEPINVRQSSYVRGYILTIYLVVGSLLYSIQIFDFWLSKWAIIGLKYYVGLPVAFLVFAILVISIASAILPFSRRLTKSKTSNDSRVELLSAFLNALNTAHESYHPFTMPEGKANRVVRELKKASTLLKEYPAVLNKSSLNANLVESFKLSSNFIEQMAIDFQTSNNTVVTEIKNKLVTCINTVVHGNLVDLPKLSIEAGTQSIVKKARAYHYFLLAIYLTTPILFVIFINLLFGIKFNEYEQSLLKILYIVWAFFGVFSNPVILNSDSKELIQDIIKSWLGKS